MAIAAAALIGLGCGGSATRTQDAHQAISEGEGGSCPRHGGHGGCNCRHGHGHGEQAGPVGEFHEAIAPLWHAPAGPERTDRTCAAVPDLRTRAAAVGSERLTAAVEDLGTACGADGRPDFEAKLGAVHEAFHAVMESH